MRLAFAITTYKDQALAEVVVGNLKKFYPLASVLVFDDAKERLKLPQFAGRWTERYLKAFLETDADVLVKIDPDVVVVRKARRFPTVEIFGQKATGHQVLGGVIGYSRAGARKIVDSGLLLDPKYTDVTQFSYARFSGKHLLDGEEEDLTPVSLQDAIMADVIQNLGLEVGNWLEAYVRTSTSDPSLTPPAGDYAFVCVGRYIKDYKAII